MGKVQLLQDNHSLTAAKQTAVKKEPERDKCHLKHKDFHIIILQ